MKQRSQSAMHKMLLVLSLLGLQTAQASTTEDVQTKTTEKYQTLFSWYASLGACLGYLAGVVIAQECGIAIPDLPLFDRNEGDLVSKMNHYYNQKTIRDEALVTQSRQKQAATIIGMIFGTFIGLELQKLIFKKFYTKTAACEVEETEYTAA